MAEISTLDLLGRLVPSLAVIIGALLLVRWYAQRGRGANRAAIKVVARAGLSKNAYVAVVQVGSARYLVGATDQSVQLLAELDEDVDLAEATTAMMGSPAGDGSPTPSATMSRLAELTNFRAAADAAAHDRPGTGVLDQLKRLTTRRPVSTSVRRAVRDDSP